MTICFKRMFCLWVLALVFGLALGVGMVHADAKININTAPSEVLQTLPGIGPALAERIIAFRTETPFVTTEDIKKVSGIGDAVFEKVKDLITTE
jgi:competence ComEA-like helix-hairpin-helix protein